jgi:hypothetical protein
MPHMASSLGMVDGAAFGVMRMATSFLRNVEGWKL